MLDKKIINTTASFGLLLDKEENNKREMKKIGKLSVKKQDEIDKLKAENAKINDQLVASIKTMDVFEACTVTSLVCQSTKNGDDAERARMQRRRTRLKGEITKAHTDFDVENKKQGKHVVLVPKYVGSPLVREAKAIHSKLSQFKELGLNVTVHSESTILSKLEDREAGKNINVTSAKGISIADVQALMVESKTAWEKEQQAKNQKKQV